MLGQILADAQAHPTHSQVRAVLEKLHGLSVAEPRIGVFRSGRDMVASGKARTRYLISGEGSEIDDLLINEEISVTERAWRLVLRGRPEEARCLMDERKDDLTFSAPPRVKRAEFSGEPAECFLVSLPIGSELRAYAEVYLARLRLPGPFPLIQSRSGAAWPRTAAGFQGHESEANRLCGMFEKTTFLSGKLERTLFATLSGLPGGGAWMPEKTATLKLEKINDYCAEVIPFVEFDAELAGGNFGAVGNHLEGFISSVKSAKWLSPGDGLDVIGYHLWRRAIMGEELSAEQLNLATVLASSSTPLKNLRFDREKRDFVSDWFDSRLLMDSVCLGLAVAEAGPRKGDAWSWSDLPGIGWDRYRSDRAKSAHFIFNAAAVAAARCGDWDEESRWRLMALFETQPEELDEAPSANSFSMFAAAGFMRKEEVAQGVREFAVRYPNRGWNFLTVVDLGRQFGDDSLVEFGLLEAEQFFEENPKLKDRAMRMGQTRSLR